MRPFAYVRAADEDRALTAGAEAHTRFLAGGTTLVDLMKLGVGWLQPRARDPRWKRALHRHESVRPERGAGRARRRRAHARPGRSARHSDRRLPPSARRAPPPGDRAVAGGAHHPRAPP